MGGKKVRARWSRWLRRVLGGLGLCLLLLLGFAAFLLGTGAGGRLVLSLADGFLPDELQLEAAGFSGRLYDRFVLEGLDVRLPTLEIAADHVTVDWRARGLLAGRIHAHAVTLDGLDVSLIETAADSSGAAPGPSDGEPLPDSPLGELPFDISFDSVRVTGMTLRMRDSVWISGGRALIGGTIDDYRLSFSGDAEVPDVATAGVSLSGTGSSTGFRLDSLAATTLGGTLSAEGELSWWPAVSWDASLRADTLRPDRVLPDPQEWPGAVSVVASSTGRLSDSGEITLQATVDTLYGELRGEPLAGRFEARLQGEDLELSAALIRWGPARVRASGSAAAVLDLEFEALAPDLGLILPGSEGRAEAAGRVTGPRDAPRVRASFEAAGLSLEDAAVAAAEGEVDVDLTGPVRATVRARQLSIGDRQVDSVTVSLSGRQDAHRLEIQARGPGGELEFTARGGLGTGNAWSGTVDALRVAADTIGSWALTDPVALRLSQGRIIFGEACFESPPARVCAEGERSDVLTRLEATVDSLEVGRLGPLMPDDLSASALLQAGVSLRLEGGAPLSGRVEIATSAGTLTRTRSGETRRLFFEPIELTAASNPDGVSGSVSVHAADSTGVRLLDVSGRLESAVAIRSLEDVRGLRGHPVSAHLEVEAEDLLLITDDFLPRWDVSGSFRATADLEIDETGSLAGSLSAATESMVLRNTVRGQGWVLEVEPARLEAQVGPDGLTGDLDLVVDVPGERNLLTAIGHVRLPRLTSLDFEPEDQPIDGSLEVKVGDIGLVEAFLIEVATARGSFQLTTNVGGTLADLTVDGQADLSDGYALIPTLGLELTDIRFSAAGRPDGTVEVNGQVRSGEGRLTLTGRSERYPSAESPSVFQLRGDRFLVMDIPEVNLLAEPNIDLAFDGSTIRLTGDVAIPRARLGFPEIPPSAVTPSEDVVIVGDSVVQRKPPVPFTADITVNLGNDVFFNGFGFASNLVGSVRVQQEAAGEPTGRGEVRFINGTFRSFGQELRVDPGRLLFAGPIDDPSVDARAFVRASDGTEAGFQIRGSVQNLDVSTYSLPPKSDSDVMAYILFGRPMSETTGTEGSEASNSAAVLGANMLAMSLAPSLGLDEARIDPGASQNKAQFVVGKYLSPRLYVGYGVGIHEPISTLRLRYLLSAKWSIEAITGDQQSTDLLWRIERGGPKPEAAASADADQQGQ